MACIPPNYITGVPGALPNTSSFTPIHPFALELEGFSELSLSQLNEIVLYCLRRHANGIEHPEFIHANTILNPLEEAAFLPAVIICSSDIPTFIFISEFLDSDSDDKKSYLGCSIKSGKMEQLLIEFHQASNCPELMASLEFNCNNILKPLFWMVYLNFMVLIYPYKKVLGNNFDSLSKTDVTTKFIFLWQFCNGLHELQKKKFYHSNLTLNSLYTHNTESGNRLLIGNLASIMPTNVRSNPSFLSYYLPPEEFFRTPGVCHNPMEVNWATHAFAVIATELFTNCEISKWFPYNFVPCRIAYNNAFETAIESINSPNESPANIFYYIVIKHIIRSILIYKKGIPRPSICSVHAVLGAFIKLANLSGTEIRDFLSFIYLRENQNKITELELEAQHLQGETSDFTNEDIEYCNFILKDAANPETIRSVFDLVSKTPFSLPRLFDEWNFHLSSQQKNYIKV